MKKHIKNLLIIIIVVPLLFFLTACDNRDDKDVEIISSDYKVGVTEIWKIYSYNNYRCSDYDKVYDEEENVYIITFKFDKLERE